MGYFIRKGGSQTALCRLQTGKKWCLLEIFALWTCLVIGISLRCVCCLSCTLSSAVGMTVHNIPQWEWTWHAGHHPPALPGLCGRIATSHEGQKGATVHSLEMFVGIVDYNERRDDVLKEFLQAKGLWPFRWAQVRRDVWRGILLGSSETSGEFVWVVLCKMCLSKKSLKFPWRR